jgi:hypothetical protein
MSQANGVIASVGGVSHAPLMARIGFRSKLPTAYGLFTDRDRRYRTRLAWQSSPPAGIWCAAFDARTLAHNILPRFCGRRGATSSPSPCGEGQGVKMRASPVRSPDPLLIALPDTHGGCVAWSGGHPWFEHNSRIFRRGIGPLGTVTHHTRIAYPVARYNARKNSAGTNSISCTNLCKQPGDQKTLRPGSL